MDSTHRIKWQVTKEEFDNCKFPDRIVSPTCAIDINGEKTKWYVSIRPKGNNDGNKNKVFIALVKKHDDKIYKVKYEFGIETQDGYWPEDALKKLYSRRSLSEEDSFGLTKDETDRKYNGWGYVPGMITTEEFKKYFVDNKVTVVAFFVIYSEGDKHLDDMKVADDFVEKIRSMSSFDNLSDFTLTSGNVSFPCHRLLLAARLSRP